MNPAGNPKALIPYNTSERVTSLWRRPEFRARQAAARERMTRERQTPGHFERFVEPEPMSGCWLWMGARIENGYGLTSHPVCGERLAHRIAWRLFRPDEHLPAGRTAMVLHRCDNRACVNPRHLYLGDHRQNMRDMASRGRAYKPVGVKITPGTAAEIRSRRESGVTLYAIAREFGVGIRSVRDVCRGLRWA